MSCSIATAAIMQSTAFLMVTPFFRSALYISADFLNVFCDIGK